MLFNSMELPLQPKPQRDNESRADYEGVDSGPFTTSQLENYRRMLLRKTDQQSRFISRLIGGQPATVLELCCGNGRLLVDLACKGLLSRGFGYDKAESRIKFGWDWTIDWNIYSINLDVGDASNSMISGGAFDVAVCITGAIQYFGQDIQKVLTNMAKASKMAVLELYNIPKERLEMLRNNVRLQTWDVLPTEDPFSHCLDSFTYNDELKFMRHEKAFIRRDGGIDVGRVEHLWYYSDSEVRALLHEVGYDSVEFFGGWDGTAYSSDSDKMIVVGRML